MPLPTIHLDTSFLIRAMVPGSNPDHVLRGWLREGREIAMSSIAWTEFLCGLLDADDQDAAEQVVTERVVYDDHDAAFAARLFNESGRRGGSLIDCMIAASAGRRGALLATLNPDDFHRFEVAGSALPSEATLTKRMQFARLV